MLASDTHHLNYFGKIQAMFHINIGSFNLTGRGKDLCSFNMIYEHGFLVKSTRT